MVVLLNLLPIVFVLIVAGMLWYATSGKTRIDRAKRLTVGIGCITILSIVYSVLQPSYLPKGTVDKLPVPQFEAVEREIKDISLKPMSGDDRDLRRKEQYNEPLPFLKESTNEQQ